MLSIVDLLDAGTISAELAAYFLATIGRGASFMVGALPGGAGKTTVMGALLNLVPEDVELVPADGMPAIRRGLQQPTPRRCYICHEISPGDYYAYLWGEPLREYFRLARSGHMLATNLHADTLEQAQAQVCRENGVPEELFRRMNLVIFLEVRRTASRTSRRVAEIWETDGRRPHERLWAAGGQLGRSLLAGPEDLQRAGATVASLTASGARTIEDVRRVLLRNAGRPL